jgi:hypothetical protein
MRAQRFLSATRPVLRGVYGIRVDDQLVPVVLAIAVILFAFST